MTFSLIRIPMLFVIMIYAHTDRTGKGTGIQDYLRKHIVQIETGSMNIINKTVEFYKKRGLHDQKRQIPPAADFKQG